MILNGAGGERLMRKYRFIQGVYDQHKREWYQTAYTMILRTMDASENKDVYLQLSDAVPFRCILREITSLTSIEALLIGGSGLLELCPQDDYIAKLRAEWQHLSNKYQLTPLPRSAWKLSQIRPINHPILRLAQVAMLLHKKEFIIDQILECRSINDIVELFSVEASEYWHSHFFTTRNNLSIPKRLGREKSLLLGINLVVPLQFAYSFFIGKEHLRKVAFELLESIPAENNRYIRSWQMQGIHPKNAFESQAIIQIVTQYCFNNRCQECFVKQQLK